MFKKEFGNPSIIDSEIPDQLSELIEYRLAKYELAYKSYLFFLDSILCPENLLFATAAYEWLDYNTIEGFVSIYNNFISDKSHFQINLNFHLRTKFMDMLETIKIYNDDLDDVLDQINPIIENAYEMVIKEMELDTWQQFKILHKHIKHKFS